MLTTHERRVLYVLRKHDGTAKHSVITQAMHRTKAADRTQALANCESLGLISSAKTPAPKKTGGRGGLVYWLTGAGSEYVEGLIELQEMNDPAKEPRAGKKGEHRASD